MDCDVYGRSLATPSVRVVLMGKLNREDLEDYGAPKLEEMATILEHLRALAEATEDAEARTAIAREAASFMKLMSNPLVTLEPVDLDRFAPGNLSKTCIK